MPLAFLLDENLPGRLFRAIQRHNLRGGDPIDAVRVGFPPDLPLSSDDPTVLRWAESEDRIVVSEDKNTMPGHLGKHLAAGHHSPGVFLIRPGASVRTIVEFLVLVAHASEPHEWRDRVEYIPY